MSTEAVPAANRNERPQWRVTVGAIHEPPVRFNHIGSGSMRSNCPRFMVPIGHVYSSGLSSNGKAVFAFMLPEVSFTVGYGCRKAAHSYPLSSPRVMRLLQSVSLCRYSAALASTGSLQCSTPHTRTMAVSSYIGNPIACPGVCTVPQACPTAWQSAAPAAVGIALAAA